MTTSSLPRLACTFMLAGVTTVCAAPLKLSCEIGGRWHPVAGVERRNAFCTVDGRKVVVPRDARWQLDGDLAENAHSIRWSPRYAVGREEAPEIERAAIVRPFRGYVHVEHSAEYFGHKQKSPLLRDYPEGFALPSLVVLAWVTEGKVTQLEVRPVPATTASKFFVVTHEFELTPPEAAGQAITLVWTGGSFLPVAPRFSHRATQAAFTALVRDDMPALRAALDAGARLKHEAYDGMTLLDHAAEAGQADAIDVLVAAGANPNYWTPGRQSTLSWAVRNGRVKAVERLLAAGAKPDDFGNEQLLHAAIRLGHDTVARPLIDAAARVNAFDGYFQSPVSRAIDAGMVEVTRELLAHRAPIDFKSEQMPRVLITQARKGHTGMVRFLLEQDIAPDVEFRDQTALLAGAVCGDADIARALLSAGASPSQASTTGMTPLMVAALHGRVEYATVLLDAGAAIDARRNEGATALHLACAGRAEQMVGLLLARGANAELLNANGRSALHLALAARSAGAVAALAAKGARIDLKHPDAGEHLEAALVLDSTPLIKAALGDGWSSEAVVQGGWTALRIAEACGSTNCARLLREAGASPDPTAPGIVTDVSELDAKLKVLHAVAPEDPRDIEAKHPAARVSVDAIVDSDGSVRFPRIVGAPDQWLAAATLDVIRTWRFAAPLREGRPVAVKIRLPLAFPSFRDRILDFFEVDVPPALVHSERARYPMKLRESGYGGEVRLHAIISADGSLEHIRVAQSVHPDLDAAAMDAVAKWTFKPGILDGKPVPTHVTIPFSFWGN